MRPTLNASQCIFTTTNALPCALADTASLHAADTSAYSSGGRHVRPARRPTRPPCTRPTRPRFLRAADTSALRGGRHVRLANAPPAGWVLGLQERHSRSSALPPIPLALRADRLQALYQEPAHYLSASAQSWGAAPPPLPPCIARVFGGVCGGCARKYV